MSEEGPALRSAAWRNVDSSGDADSFVTYLDRAAANMRELRTEAMGLLQLEPGCSVLDVGCGAGLFVIEAVGAAPGIRAVGVDASEEMVSTAASRARIAGVEATFVTGDAQRLDFPDSYFDRVNCMRVLLHLEEPQAAINEMTRVLTPGGRVVVVEPDFDALMIDSDDLATARAVRRQLTLESRNPDIGRRLRRMLIDGGLEVLDAYAVARRVASLDYLTSQFHFLQQLDRAVAAGDVEAGAADEWRRWIEDADVADRLFVAPVLFRAVAIKPLAGSSSSQGRAHSP
jgi:ubiquinone/menaquinone biosynthesis C-methylase UbiE